MKKFIPKEKLGKKARKQLDSEQRSTWAFSPVTKKVESIKLYNRKRKAHDRYDDYGMAHVLFVGQGSRQLRNSPFPSESPRAPIAVQPTDNGSQTVTLDKPSEHLPDNFGLHRVELDAVLLCDAIAKHRPQVHQLAVLEGFANAPFLVFTGRSTLLLSKG